MDAGNKGRFDADYSTRRRLNGGRRHEEAEAIGTGNRERRQERIRELTESGPGAGKRPAASRYEKDTEVERASSGSPRKQGAFGSGPSVPNNGGAGSGAGPYGTRVYAPPPEGLDAEPDELWQEAWPLPSEKDPELEWKRSANPWQRLEEASGSLSAPFRKQEGRTPSSGRRSGSGGSRSGSGGTSGFRRELQVKLLLSAVLFGAVWGLFQLSGGAARQGQALVTEALTEQMDFTRLAGWYNQVFAGAPSFIPGFGIRDGEQTASVGGTVKPETVSPLEGGAVVKTFAESLGGVEMAGQAGGAVRAAEQGRVQVVSADDAKGPTIVIQHADGRTTYYGQLGEAGVQVNDWVTAGQVIGKMGSAAADGSLPLLYFAVKDNDRYVDPAEVVPLD
ncbi:peptidoglycan DD-metalloendopeptidase family protein [Paenibacillus sp. D51F]